MMLHRVFLLSLLAAAGAFTPSCTSFPVHPPPCSHIHSYVAPNKVLTGPRYSTETEEEVFVSSSSEKFVERGVSVDQDGKSNVWAIEPKIELESKSSEEQTQGVLIAGAGIAIAAVAAAGILTNLPDPNQF